MLRKFKAKKNAKTLLMKQITSMNFREATINDIPALHSIRITVKENILPDPSIITKADYEIFLTTRGKGWLCEVENNIVGFTIVDLKEKNIWALFVHPGFENRGIGKKLHDIMLHWYFDQTKEIVWLRTAPGTRAEEFYRRAGWKEIGVHGKGEIKFEMNYLDWSGRLL